MSDRPGTGARPTAPAAGAGRLLASSGKVLASRIVIYVGALVTVVITARELGTTGRGAITLILTIVSLGSVIFSVGIPVAGRLLLVGDDPVTSGAYFGLALGMTAVEAIVTPLVAAAFLPAVDVHLGFTAFLVIGALAAVNGFAYRMVSSIAAYGRVAASSSWTATGYVAQGALCALAVAVAEPNVVGFVGLLAAGMTIPAVGAVWDLHRNGRSMRPVFDRPGWRRLIRTGVPSLSTIISESATFRIDRLILGLFRNPAAVGIYSAAATASEMFRFIPWSINQLVFYEVVVGRLSKRRLRHIRFLTIGAMVIVAGVGALIAPWMIETLLGPSFGDAVEPFRILLLAELGLAWYLFDSTLLLSSRQVRLAAIAAMFGLGMILVADFLLISAYGITGAAIASVVTYWAMAGVARRLLAQARRRGQIKLLDPEAELEAEVEASAPPIIES